MFAQADPGTVRSTLHAAGFAHVELEPVTVPLRLGGTAEEGLEHLVDSGPGRATLAAVPEDRRPAALDAVRDALADRARDDGVFLGGGIWLVRAH
jgi:hypothetical protein